MSFYHHIERQINVTHPLLTDLQLNTVLAKQWYGNHTFHYEQGDLIYPDWIGGANTWGDADLAKIYAYKKEYCRYVLLSKDSRIEYNQIPLNRDFSGRFYETDIVKPVKDSTINLRNAEPSYTQWFIEESPTINLIGQIGYCYYSYEHPYNIGTKIYTAKAVITNQNLINTSERKDNDNARNIGNITIKLLSDLQLVPIPWYLALQGETNKTGFINFAYASFFPFNYRNTGYVHNQFSMILDKHNIYFMQFMYNERDFIYNFTTSDISEFKDSGRVVIYTMFLNANGTTTFNPIPKIVNISNLKAPEDAIKFAVSSMFFVN